MPDRRVTLMLILLGVLARAAAVLALQSHTVKNSTYEHGPIASNLLAGRGFSVRFLGANGPTSQQAPVYPCIVAAAYAIGGAGTPRALLILELGQSALGGLLVGATMLLARQVAPGGLWVARTSGLIVALHPTLVYASTHVQVAGLAALLLTLTLVTAYRAAFTLRRSDALIVGGLLALLILTDPILGLAAIGVGWLFRSAPQRLALIAATTAAGLLPWTMRNYIVHGEFVAVKSTFGYAFWQGNCALSNGTDKVVRPSVEHALKSADSTHDAKSWNAALWRARHEAGYLDDVALTPADYRVLAAVSEPERSRILFHRALADLRADPARYPTLCLRRLRYFWLFDETNPKTRSLLYRTSHLGLTALALVGLVCTRPETRRRLGPTLLTAALIATFHALTIVSARFHIPIEPMMAVWAACGLTRWEQVSTATTGNVDGVGIARRLGSALRAVRQVPV